MVTNVCNATSATSFDVVSSVFRGLVVGDDDGDDEEDVVVGSSYSLLHVLL